MKQYNLGIIGAGMYGKMMMRQFQKDERANILWVNSASEGTTKSAAQEFGVELVVFHFEVEHSAIVDGKGHGVVGMAVLFATAGPG